MLNFCSDLVFFRFADMGSLSFLLPFFLKSSLFIPTLAELLLVTRGAFFPAPFLVALTGSLKVMLLVFCVIFGGKGDPPETFRAPLLLI